jgi:general stress protein YciG
VATDRNTQGSNQGSRGRRGGGSERGFAAMDAAKQREIARKGGQASARSQVRDEQGQFGGKREGGSRSGGSSNRAANSRGGGR